MTSLFRHKTKTKTHVTLAHSFLYRGKGSEAGYGVVDSHISTQGSKSISLKQT